MFMLDESSSLIESRHHKGKTAGATAGAATTAAANNTTACVRSVDSDIEARHHKGKAASVRTHLFLRARNIAISFA